MKFLTIIRYNIIVLTSISLLSCSGKKEVFETEALADYMPLAVGKSITYRLDSLVFTNFGRKTETHAYQLKNVIDAKLIDNEGHESYRVYRYMRDSAGLQPWQATGSYSITVLADQIELTDDNLRVIKMHMPLKNGFAWKGNKFLPPDPYGAKFINFSNDNGMSDWDFYYDGEPAAFSYKGKNYTDVLTVEQENFSDNFPILNTAIYAANTRSVERYSKTIGLVYREYELWEYQPNTGNPGGPYKAGFGIKMWMIDHN
jgi:hypothetical protein